MVLAVSSTCATLMPTSFFLIIRSSSLYILYATKHMQTCASILLSVKWNIGRMSNAPFEILKALSTTQSPRYSAMTSPASSAVFVIYPFNPSHLLSSAILSSLMTTSTSLLISRNLLYPRLFTCCLVSLPLLYALRRRATPRSRLYPSFFALDSE